MTNRISHSGLKIDSILYDFVNHQALTDTGISSDDFWQAFSNIIKKLTPKNTALLNKRAQLQKQIDAFHQNNKAWNSEKYQQFLSGIGYLVPDEGDFIIKTLSVDNEIAKLAGPQLVVPVNNARFALNAANARWGSLYDALYGTDVIAQKNGAEKTSQYNQVRGLKVIQYAKDFLDTALPLSRGSHHNCENYAILDGELVAKLTDNVQVNLENKAQLIGYTGTKQNPSSILLKNNGLHIDIQIDAQSLIGSSDKAGIKDVVLESALTTIMDCEDSVAAVDAEDKTLVYQNWLGLMQGTLSESFEKSGKVMQRTLNSDRHYTNLNDQPMLLKGRSLMFVRNVGHLMTNPAILDENGAEVYEGIMDAMLTSLCALHDIKGSPPFKNSTAQSINIVKPKMHGPEEVAFTCELFSEVEMALNLTKNTLKMGIMDEERRTTVNLKECIRQAKERIVFINTGFLDRTGDEIHTSMMAGLIMPKADIKSQPWITAYENSNVEIGLVTGLSQKAQIGKGMWAMPDEMAAMMTQKIAHLESGANTAWVPSPTAATLHALHYHQVNVFDVQKLILERQKASLSDILTPPLMQDDANLTSKQIQAELDNNAQGILGYVVRWIDQGVGCSKVPDINHIGLMEDRATLRISSQHMANWLHHGLCDEVQIISTMKRMAKVVDLQNSNDKSYINMADSEQSFTNSIAFQAALELVLQGVNQPNGYTEPVLHRMRLKLKSMAL
ncbi:malate synthase G [Pseudoalteromonas denitrificans]|uniref:Malate synthase G n=1 Tax=Pseudoalteromonas denitrificans DSM 6059 TaxID=1123010 RepID=A0A1I1S0F9_9GAMM|nr:malate synthase G [Pseudoalteromonas denitrificans]SFD37263.1 malate synthase [Pseudoalteromonas denitrificans DSM 6059]